MLPSIDFIAFGALFFALGIGGVAASRHLVVIMLAVEIMFIGSIIAAVGYFSSGISTNGSFFIMLMSIWAVASSEIIVLIMFYVYMKGRSEEFDVSKMNSLKG